MIAWTALLIAMAAVAIAVAYPVQAEPVRERVEERRR